MKIKQSILDVIDKPTSRNRIAMELGCGEQNIAVHMSRNRPNGRLTKMDALVAIAKEAQVGVDEILEETNVNAA